MKFRKKPFAVLASILLFSTSLLGQGLENVVLVFQGETRGEGKLYAILPSVVAGLSAGGVDVDELGRIYVSEVGSAPGFGSIIMIPADGTPIRIMVDFDEPTDIEMAPDQRSIIVAMKNGKVVRRNFGVSVKVHFSQSLDKPVAFLTTDQGTYVARLTADGYFHFDDMLGPLQTSTTVDLVVRNGVFIQNYPGLDLDTLDGEIVGQTIIEVSL